MSSQGIFTTVFSWSGYAQWLSSHYGLKKRHLQKFKKNVEKFYSKNINDKVYKSELAINFQKRFERDKQNLFTFIEYDSIPWHNNTAENAIRHLAVQRKISGSFFESGATAYLVLLGIMKTCKSQNKSFLKFLLSKEKDVDKFKSSKKRKSIKPLETALIWLNPKNITFLKMRQILAISHFSKNNMPETNPNLISENLSITVTLENNGYYLCQLSNP